MTGSNWDAPPPAPPRGRRRWTKWAIGCGVAGLLAAGGLAVIGNVLANRAFQDPKVRGPFVAKALWPQLRRTAQELGDDAGARALYARNRGLRDRYPTEEVFLAAVRDWRPSLAAFPEEPPGPDRLDLHLPFFGVRAVVLLPDGRRFLVVSRGRGKGHIPIVDLQLR